MDLSARFFTKLRTLAVSLETETASLQHAHQNFDEEGSTECAVRLLHELHSEVRDMKREVGDQIAHQQAKETETRNFIKACMVLKQRSTEDIQRLQRYYEKYGYQAPKNVHKCSVDTGQDAEDPSKENEEEGKVGEEEEEQQTPPVTPMKVPPPPTSDPMRTPQLSDFGLSEIHLKNVLGVSGFSCDTVPMPVMPFPYPSMTRTVHLPTPKTPKCTLRMDEDDLLTPRMEDLGISEHTMCLNNDFTMDLHRKHSSKTLSSSASSGLKARTCPVLSSTPPNPDLHSFASDEGMKTPEPPEFCTPGFMINKSHGRSSPSPSEPTGDMCPSPEIPAFQTLCKTRKDDRGYPASSRGNHKAWEYEVPEMTIGCPEDKHTPETPSLESFIGSSLSVRGVGGNEAVGEMGSGGPATPCGLERDCPTQEFNLCSPRVRGEYPEPRTPEMPDFSSVTQDICKMVSQMKKPPPAGIQSQTRPTGKENRRGQGMSVVSEREFLSLPSYLRQISLSSLNQTIHQINSAAEKQLCGGGAAVFLMEELKSITGTGNKAPLYFLCLKELKRLEHVQDVGTAATYRVLTHI
ncbi:spindle and kinetochore-associated protein 3 [Osmerus mordax]|uniref:spindle and kinetochore-associated protein 3 n=1 Tax=Osmerus mordax TaxID=8014 RepID=UPI00350FA54B